MNNYLGNHWRVAFSEKAEKKFDKLDQAVRIRINAFLNEKVLAQANPRRYGKQLSGIHSNTWSYRIGDYRLLAQINDSELVILTIDIGHRREIYRTFA